MTLEFSGNHLMLLKLLSTDLSDVYISLNIAYICVVDDQKLDKVCISFNTK